MRTGWVIQDKNGKGYLDDHMVTYKRIHAAHVFALQREATEELDRDPDNHEEVVKVQVVPRMVKEVS